MHKFLLSSVLLQTSETVVLQINNISAPPALGYEMLPAPAHVRDSPFQKDDLSVSIVEEQGKQLITLKNDGKHSFHIPLSTDGALVYQHCPDKVLSTAHVSTGGNGKVFHAIIELYGCEQFIGTVKTLLPGESLNLVGASLQTQSSAPLMFSLGEVNFTTRNGKLIEELKTLLYLNVKRTGEGTLK